MVHRLFQFWRARLPLVLMLVLLLAVMVLPDAIYVSAGVDYCSNDPIISVNGQLQYVDVMVPLSQVANIEGPVRVTVNHPNVPAHVVFVDQSNFAQEVKLTAGKAWDPTRTNTLKVVVNAKAKDGVPNFPIRLRLSNALGTVTVDGRTGISTTGQLPLN